MKNNFENKKLNTSTFATQFGKFKKIVNFEKSENGQFTKFQKCPILKNSKNSNKFPIWNIQKMSSLGNSENLHSENSKNLQFYNFKISQILLLLKSSNFHYSKIHKIIKFLILANFEKKKQIFKILQFRKLWKF